LPTKIFYSKDCMHLVKLIIAEKWMGLFAALCITVSTHAQENSPYSRYGVGDLTPNQNILNRAMGGISAAYTDYQTVNFVNPASYGNIGRTIFDIGAEADVRTLKSINSAKKFTNTNALFSWAFPSAALKWPRKNVSWGWCSV
jgi:hypothetical protein